MKALRVAVFCSVASMAGATAFLACGGSDAVVDGNDGGDDGGRDGGGNSGGGQQDSGPSSNVEAGSDAGPGSTTNLTPDPGMLRCGAQSCDTSEQTCCVQTDGGGRCVNGNGNGGGPNGCGPAALRARCDEKADCEDEGDVCCGTLEFQVGPGFPFRGLRTQCDDRCGMGVAGRLERQICKTNAECPDAGSCVPFSCRGRTVGVCGGIGIDAGAACD